MNYHHLSPAITNRLQRWQGVCDAQARAWVEGELAGLLGARQPERLVIPFAIEGNADGSAFTCRNYTAEERRQQLEQRWPR